MGDDRGGQGSTLAGGTQEGFSGEGTLGQSQPWEDLGRSVSGGIRRACSRPGGGTGWSHTKAKAKRPGGVSEGEVGEDGCVWGPPATDVLGLFMGGPSSGDVPGWAGETTLSLERDH